MLMEHVVMVKVRPPAGGDAAEGRLRRKRVAGWGAEQRCAQRASTAAPGPVPAARRPQVRQAEMESEYLEAKRQLLRTREKNLQVGGWVAGWRVPCAAGWLAGWLRACTPALLAAAG